jgi:hypothetical protein
LVLNMVRRAIAFVLLTAAAAAAQSDPPRALIGRVRDAADSTSGIEGARVEVAGSSRRQVVKKDGFFSFTDLPSRVELVVTRLGYESVRRRIALDSNGTTTVDVLLHRLPQRLTEVSINGRTVSVPSRFADAYARGARGMGTFFTREDIEQLQPTDIKALLQSIPTVATNQRGITFQRCQAGIPSRELEMGKRNTGSVQVYVDGKRMSRTVDQRMMSDDEIEASGVGDANEILSMIPVSTIQAIEVYTGAMRIPAEFSYNACAVVAVWTKSF